MADPNVAKDLTRKFQKVFNIKGLENASNP